MQVTSRLRGTMVDFPMSGIGPFAPVLRFRRPLVTALLGGLVLGALTTGIAMSAAGDGVSTGSPCRTEQNGAKLLSDLMDEYSTAEAKLKEEMVVAVGRERADQRFAIDGPLERLSDFGPRFLALADQFPRSDVAWSALRIIVYVRGFDAETKSRAMNAMVRDFVGRDEFYDDLYFHLYRPGIDAEAFYRIVLKSSTAPRRVIGLTKYSLAVRVSRVMEDSEDLVEDVRLSEALSLLKSVELEYSDCAHPWLGPERMSSLNLGSAARDLLFRLTHLRIGMLAPDIIGTDVFGNDLRLSDYRGRVVLLVFCGDWCAPCREMYTHEIRLMNDYRGRPLSIVGVNTDSKEKFIEATKREGFPWRSFWDGGSTAGPITSRWCITRFPMFFLLDREGIIRGKTFPGKSTDDRVAAIREAIERIPQ